MPFFNAITRIKNKLLSIAEVILKIEIPGMAIQQVFAVITVM